MIYTFVLWEALCAALFWSVFCRLVRTCPTTRLDVRIALVLVGTAALIGIGAPIYSWLPDWVTLVIVGAVVVMQMVMARHWLHGVPRQFIYEQHRPKRRTGDLA
jgi:hypothetical protein